MIPYGKQWIDDGDIQAVIDVLKSDYLTQGPKIPEFEKAICEYTGAEYCIAVSNGTVALDLAVKCLQLPEGSEGITTPNTFVASSNCMLYNQIKPGFADIEKETHNVDPDGIQNLITDKTRLLMPVHFAGLPANMERINEIGLTSGCKIIEDAAHALGASYENGSKVGNCRYSDLTTFSFHPVKHITTGEGGAITTNNKELYECLIMLRTHGITKKKSMLEVYEGPWYYEMQLLGNNYRITDIQAALGQSQIKKLDRFVQRRREIAQRYIEAFQDIPWLKVPDKSYFKSSSFHLFVVEIDFKSIGKDRAMVMEKLKTRGIGTQVHYIPVYRQPYYRNKYGYVPVDYPVNEEYYSKALSIPMYPKMTEQDVDQVIREIKNLGK